MQQGDWGYRKCKCVHSKEPRISTCFMARSRNPKAPDSVARQGGFGLFYFQQGNMKQPGSKIRKQRVGVSICL